MTLSEWQNLRRDQVKTKVWIAAAGFAVFLVAIILISRDPDIPDVKFLSTDAHFLVGGERITLPFVAVRRIEELGDFGDPLYGYHDSSRQFASDAYKTRFLGFAANRVAPMEVAFLGISLDAYQYYGEHIASVEICPLLTRRWSRHVCQTERPGILKHAQRWS
jgi:hypothetical protein